MIVKNTHATNYATLADTVNITASSASLQLVTPGRVTRIAPGQSVIVQIGVKNSANVAPGTACTGTVTATWGGGYGALQSAGTAFSGKCGFGDYTADATSLATHWNPDWFNEVKFGIFIHWGVYAAPAYGSVQPNEDYAEWYGKRMYDPTYRTQTYQYHNETYGEDFNYDDFIANFTASQWDAQAWVDLIAAAGAQYMVPVTSESFSRVTGHRLTCFRAS